MERSQPSHGYWRPFAEDCPDYCPGFGTGCGAAPVGVSDG